MINVGSIESLADIGLVNGKTASKRTDEKRPAKAESDTVELSKDAQQAAAVAKIAAQDAGSEIRKEAVDAARKRIEEGTYRIQNVVALVAARLTHYV